MSVLEVLRVRVGAGGAVLKVLKVQVPKVLKVLKVLMKPPRCGIRADK